MGIANAARRLASLGCAALLTGCLLIAEDAVDVAALNGTFPLSDGADYTYCSWTPEGQPDCLRVRAARDDLNGGAWTRLRPLEALESDAPDEDLLLLFFRHEEMGDLALMRVPDEVDVYLMLTRVESTADRILLTVPLCSGKAGDPLGGPARAAGAEVDDEAGCLFDNAAGFFDVGAIAVRNPDTPLFGTITIEK